MKTLRRIRVNLSPYWGNLNNREVADELNLNINTVSSYRNGNIRNPNIEVLMKFRDYFSQKLAKKLSLEDLLQVEEERD